MVFGNDKNSLCRNNIPHKILCWTRQQKLSRGGLLVSINEWTHVVFLIWSLCSFASSTFYSDEIQDYKILTLTVVTGDGWTEDRGLECVELIPNYHPITMLMNSNHNTIDEVPFQLPDLVSLHLIPHLLDTECLSNSSSREKGRATLHTTLTACQQQQLMKRDIWQQLRDIFGGVDPFYGFNVVNHMKVFLLMMTLYSSVTLPLNSGYPH